MRCSSSLLALAALTVGQAAAGVLNHRHFHTRRAAHASLSVSENVADISKRSVLTASDGSFLKSLGFLDSGVNSATNNGGVWLGNDGPYTNDFQNNSTEQVILTIWTGATSWVNTNKPQITVSLPPGSVQTVSFAEGASGGWAPVYSTTKLALGQISETWGEFTFSGSSSTVDVSREVNMAGRGMRVETPTCVTDMDTCVFVCKGGLLTCWLDYALKNCEPGSQPGANYGTSYGMPSGGCSNMGKSPKLKTYFY